MNNGYYTFPALRGRQGEHDYFILLCPLHLAPRIFLYDSAQSPPAWPPRPSLDPGKIENLAHFIHTHADTYVLAPLVATVTTDVEFTPAGDAFPDLGAVKIPLSATMFVQDGQHRRAAIEQLLTNTPLVNDNTIAVMLIPDPALDRSPAIFAALNQGYVQRNASRRLAQDPTKPLAAVVRRITEDAPIFRGRVDYEHTTISNRSIALFTMNAVFQATQALLGVAEQEEISGAQAAQALQFWTALGEVIPEWRRVIEGDVSPAALRPTYVHVHSVTLLAIGRAGAALIAAFPDKWQTKLELWAALDWSRNNPTWEGRAMLHGRMSKQHTSIQLTANFLKMTLGLSLTEKENELERLISR
jgi:DNA sulfur modification protein DndB